MISVNVYAPTGELLEIKELDLEFNTPETTYSVEDDIDTMLVDHEFRLTLLELGVTE